MVEYVNYYWRLPYMDTIRFNPILMCGDAYKYSTHKILSNTADTIQCYFGTRSHPFILLGVNQLTHMLATQVTEADIVKLSRYVSFDTQPWLDLVEEHDGYLPITVRSMPEGSLVQPHTPAITIDINDHKYLWICPIIEAITYQSIWYMSTVGTRVFEMCDVLSANGLPRYFVPQYNRGCSTQEQSAKASAAWSLVTGRVDLHAHNLEAYHFSEHTDIRNIHVLEHMTILTMGEDEAIAWAEKHGGAIMYDTHDKDAALAKIKNISNIGLMADDGNVKNEMMHVYESLKLKFRTYPTVCQLDNMPYGEWVDLVQTLSKSDIPVNKMLFCDEKYSAHEITRDTLGFAYKVCCVTRGGTKIPVGKHKEGSLKATVRGYFELPEMVFKDGERLKVFSTDSIHDRINKPEV